MSQILPMGQVRSDTRFKQRFMARVRYARLSAGYENVSEFARALRIPQDKYNKYEWRSLLPHYFVTQFCAITRISEKWLFTDADPPGMPEVPPKRRRRPATKAHDGGRKAH